MSRDGRVQIRDLEAPEAIRPYGFQSDTYARPPEPMINNDLENLQRALGAFGSGMMALHERQQRDAEKAQKLALENGERDAKARLAEWHASKQSGERMDAYYAGTAPFQNDPIYSKFTRTMWAQDEGEKFAAEIQADPELAANIGKEGFNAEAYLAQKAAPYIERMKGNPDLMVTFGKSFEQTRDQFLGAHARQRGEYRLNDAKEKVYDQLSRAFDDGTNNKGLRGQPLNDEYRRLYQTFGLRENGGITHLTDEQLDEITLAVLADKAGNAAQAEAVMDMLDVDRVSMRDGTTKLPALSAALKNRSVADTIREKARKTLATAEEAEVRERLAQNDRALFARTDGSWNAIADYQAPNKWDKANPIKASAQARKEAAAEAWLANQRDAHGEDVQREVEFFQRNSIKHPQYFPLLEAGANGLATTPLTTQKGVPPDAVEKAVQLGTLYMNMTRNGAAFTNNNLNDNAKQFYQMYRIGMQYQHLTAEEAAIQAIRVTSTIGGNADPHIISQQGAAIGEELARIKPGAFKSAIANPQDLFYETEQLAKVISMADGKSAKDAVAEAIKLVNDDVVQLNGRAIYGVSGMTKAELPAAQKLLTDVFNASPAIMKKYGVDRPEGLSLAPLADGAFVVVQAENGRPILDERMKGLFPNVDRFQAIRAELDHETKRIQAEGAAEQHAQDLKALQVPRYDSPASAAIKSGASKAGTVIKGVAGAVGGAIDENVIDPFRKVYGSDGTMNRK